MSKEFKHYQLRATKRPAKCPVLSTTVAVYNERGESGYCYINFSDTFVEAVGKRLSRGVAPFDPAFISVRYNAQLQSWEIWARYLRDQLGVLLWATADKPSWLNFYKLEAEHGSRQTHSHTPSDRTLSACA